MKSGADGYPTKSPREHILEAELKVRDRVRCFEFNLSDMKLNPRQLSAVIIALPPDAIIYHMQFDYNRRLVELFARSIDFDETWQGAKVPRARIICKSDPRGEIFCEIDKDYCG